MVSDAESHAEDDKRQRELVEARNNAESAAYNAEKQVKDLGDQVDEASKQEIEAAIAEVNEAVKGEDTAAINAAAERLQTAFHKVSEAMYQRAQAEQAADGATAENGSSANGSGVRRGRGGRRRRGGGRVQVSRRHDSPDRAPPRASQPEETVRRPSGARGFRGAAGRPRTARSPQDLDQLVAKARERDEYLALAQRTQADFENYRTPDGA